MMMRAIARELSGAILTRTPLFRFAIFLAIDVSDVAWRAIVLRALARVIRRAIAAAQRDELVDVDYNLAKSASRARLLDERHDGEGDDERDHLPPPPNHTPRANASIGMPITEKRMSPFMIASFPFPLWRSSAVDLPDSNN